MKDFFGFAAELLAKGRANKGDAYGSAEIYDLVVRDGSDDRFYAQFARKQGGRVLYLACGSGRLIPLLLEAGLEVKGLDLSLGMLKKARKLAAPYAGKVDLVQGDMRSFSCNELFETVIIPYCSFMYLHNDQDRKSALKNCFEHLKPGGYLVFDFLAGEVEPGEGFPELALQGIHPFSEDILISVVQVKGVAADLRILNQINYVYPKGEIAPYITVYSSKEAIVLPEKIVELLKQVGFRSNGVYANSKLQKYDGGEECLIIAQK